MKILYFGKEQTSGFIQTIFTIHGGYVADIDENYVEYIDFTSFDYYKTLSDEAVVYGIPNTMRPYSEFWTNDQTGDISTTWRLTKDATGEGKPLDENGHTWSKVKTDWTAEEERYIMEFDSAWLVGKVTVLAKSAYLRLNSERGTLEKDTWLMQLSQAQEYKKTGSAGHLLSELAQARGETVSTFADKIIKNNDEYQKGVAKILGLQQRIIKEIESATDQRELMLAASKYTGMILFYDAEEKTPMHELFKNIV